MSTDEFAAAFPFRLRQLEEAYKEYLVWRRKVDDESVKQTEQLTTLDKRMDAMTEAMDALRKTLTAASITVAIACVTFSLSVLVATGKV